MNDGPLTNKNVWDDLSHFPECQSVTGSLAYSSDSNSPRSTIPSRRRNVLNPLDSDQPICGDRDERGSNQSRDEFDDWPDDSSLNVPSTAQFDSSFLPHQTGEGSDGTRCARLDRNRINTGARANAGLRDGEHFQNEATQDLNCDAYLPATTSSFGFSEGNTSPHLSGERRNLETSPDATKHASIDHGGCNTDSRVLSKDNFRSTNSTIASQGDASCWIDVRRWTCSCNGLMRGFTEADVPPNAEYVSRPSTEEAIIR